MFLAIPKTLLLFERNVTLFLFVYLLLLLLLSVRVYLINHIVNSVP